MTTRKLAVKIEGAIPKKRMGVISAFAMLRDVESRLRTEYHDEVADEMHAAVDEIMYELVRLKNPLKATLSQIEVRVPSKEAKGG